MMSPYARLKKEPSWSMALLRGLVLGLVFAAIYMSVNK